MLQGHDVGMASNVKLGGHWKGEKKKISSRLGDVYGIMYMYVYVPPKKRAEGTPTMPHLPLP